VNQRTAVRRYRDGVLRGLANAELFFFPAGFGRLSVSVNVDSGPWLGRVAD